MKNAKQNPPWCTLAAPCGLLVFLLSSAGPLLAADVVETRITFDPADQDSPEINGDRIVWQDHAFGLFDIWLHNAATGAMRRVTHDTAIQHDPDVFGDTIAWIDSSADSFGIYMYDIPSGTTELMVQRIAADLAIFGPRVIWVDPIRLFESETVTVYNYETDSVELRWLFGDNSQDPAIYDDYVAWGENRTVSPREHRIWVYDLSTGSSKYLRGASSWPKIDPALYGHKLVWVGGLARVIGEGVQGSEVWIYDLVTDEFRRLTHDFHVSKRNTAIHGNRVVWEDRRNGNWDIYLYDLATETEMQVTFDPADQTQPAIHGDRIVWTDARHGNLDIYMATLVPTIAELLRHELLDMIGYLTELFDRGELHWGHRASLSALLEHVSRSMGSDEIAAARNQAHAFLNQLKAIAASGHLSEKVSIELEQGIISFLEKLEQLEHRSARVTENIFGPRFEAELFSHQAQRTAPGLTRDGQAGVERFSNCESECSTVAMIDHLPRCQAR